MNPANKRVLWRDIARAIGISLVVYGHVERGLGAAGLVSRTNFILNSDYAIYTFHMPLFFLLSGLNVDRSLLKGRKKFIQDKLWLIAYPYFLWSLIQGCVQIALASYINSPPTFRRLLEIAWAPIGQFWFLYALFLCHFLSMIFATRIRALVPIALISFACFCLYPHALPGIFSKIEYMFPFYLLGVFLGKRESRTFIKEPLLPLILALSVTVYTLGVYWGRVASHGTEYNLASIPACLAGILMIVAISQYIEHQANWVTNAFVGLGTASMTIFVLHILVGSGARVVLRRLGMIDLPIQVAVGTLAGIFIPLFGHKVLERYKLLTPIGLAPRRSVRHNQLIPA